MATLKRARAAAVAVLTVGALGACGGGGGGGQVGTIEYWLWDSGQQPGYQKCADAFQAANPGLTVHISQYGWDDYWSKLTAGFIADTAPDVFTDHLAKYAQFVDLEVLRPLDDLAPTADIQDTDYQEGLAELWKGQDGKRYGAPKDWDTVAMFYDRKALQAAGVDEADLRDLSWNPQDGGTFEKMVAHLTIDDKGVRGDEPGFDSRNVRTYGLSSEGSGGAGWGRHSGRRSPPAPAGRPPTATPGARSSTWTSPCSRTRFGGTSGWSARDSCPATR
jgi:multiple sugar transport system substrate-binding protein